MLSLLQVLPSCGAVCCSLYKAWYCSAHSFDRPLHRPACVRPYCQPIPACSASASKASSISTAARASCNVMCRVYQCLDYGGFVSFTARHGENVFGITHSQGCAQGDCWFAAVLCCARAVPCRAVPCRAVPCRAILCQVVPCCAVLAVLCWH